MLRAAAISALALALGAAGSASARQAPVAALSAPAIVYVGQDVTLDASTSSHDPAGTILDYAWDTDGSGAFALSTGVNPRLTLRPAASGPLTIAVRITDDAGATSRAEHVFTVEPAPSSGSTPSGAGAGGTTSSGGGGGAAGTSPTGTTAPTSSGGGGGGGGGSGGGGSGGGGSGGGGSGGGGGAPGGGSGGGGGGSSPGGSVAAIGGDPVLGVAALTGVAQQWLRVGSRRAFAALSGPVRRRVGAVRRRGLTVNLLADRAATFVLGAYVKPAVARRMRIRGPRLGGLVRVARAKLGLPVAGQRARLVRLPKRVRRGLRARTALVIAGHAVDARRNRAAVRRAFALR